MSDDVLQRFAAGPALKFKLTHAPGLVVCRFERPLETRPHTGVYRELKEVFEVVDGVEHVEMGRYRFRLIVDESVSSPSAVLRETLEILEDYRSAIDPFGDLAFTVEVL